MALRTGSGAGTTEALSRYTRSFRQGMSLRRSSTDFPTVASFPNGVRPSSAASGSSAAPRVLRQRLDRRENREEPGAGIHGRRGVLDLDAQPAELSPHLDLVLVEFAARRRQNPHTGSIRTDTG